MMWDHMYSNLVPIQTVELHRMGMDDFNLSTWSFCAVNYCEDRFLYIIFLFRRT